VLETGWLFVGCVAVLATAGAVLAPLRFDDDVVAMVLGIAGFVSWGVWTYGTLDVVVVGESVTYTFSMPALTLFGVCMALIPGYVGFVSPIEVVARAREGDVREL